MGPEDLDAVERLCRILGYAPQPAELQGRLAALVADGEDNGLFVALDGSGTVTGFVHVFRRPMLEGAFCAQIQAVVVDRAARRQGIGARLVQAAEEWARQRGLRRLVLYSRSDRDDAHDFYAKEGFEPELTCTRFVKDLG